MSVLQEPKWIPFLSQRWTLYLLLFVHLFGLWHTHTHTHGTHAHTHTHQFINCLHLTALSFLKRAEEYCHSGDHLVNSALMGPLHLQRVTVHWAAVSPPCCTMGKPSTEPRWKMGPGLLFHARLDVLMVNRAEFICYSVMDYYGNWPPWKFQRWGNTSHLSASVSLSLSPCFLSPNLSSIFR